MISGIFSKMKNAAVAKILEKQLAELPKEYRDMMIKAVQENPDVFKKIADEIEVAKKSGMNEQYATMQVMRKYQSNLQQLFAKAVSNT